MRSKLIVAALLGTVAMPAAAYAQALPLAPPPAAAIQSTDDDIIVTAQRREERLQDVPISITALDDSRLQRQGASGTADLETVVPGLSLAKSSTVVQPSLRGVGTSFTGIGNDPSVPVYIDGVYILSASSLVFAFNNIQRVEVLKGPQGTLFGRNSTGGLIQVVTKDPTTDLSGRISVGYGNYGRLQTQTYISGGSGSVAADIAVVYDNQADGWGRNFYTPAAGEPALRSNFDRDAGDERDIGIRSKLVWTGDDTVVKLSLMYNQGSGSRGHYRHLLPGNRNLVVNPTYNYTVPYAAGSQGEGFYDYNSDQNWRTKNNLYLGSLDVSHDAGAVTLKSITSYQRATASYNIPSDATPQLSRNNVIFNAYWRGFTEEVQVLSNDSWGVNWLSWIAGLYYLDMRTGTNPTYFVTGDNVAVNLLRFGNQTTQSIAPFAQATAKLGKTTRLTLGIRYTSDQIGADQYILSGPAAVLPNIVTATVPGVKKTFKAVTWRASLDHKFGENFLGYISASRGFKSGTFNAPSLCTTTLPVCPTTAPPVQPEYINSYEAGFKSDLFGRRLRVNGAIFHYDYANLQYQAVVGTPPIALLTNAAKARINGAELEVSLRITPTFRINYNAIALRSKYVSFPGAIAFAPRSVAPFNAAQITIDATGNSLSRAPEYAGTLGFDWTIPLGRSEINLTGNWFHSAKIYWEPQNRVVQPRYDLFDAQISWRKDNLLFRLWGKNLTNKQYYGFETTSTNGDQGSPGAPRTYGVAAQYSF